MYAIRSYYVDVAGAIVDYLQQQAGFPELDVRQRLTVTAGYGVTELRLGEILVAVITGSNKSPYALPLRMYPIMVFLVEGVVILAGLFFDQTITDFSWLGELGLSQVWVAVIGLVFILIGGYLSYEIWILLGFHQYHPVIALVIVNIPYVLYFLVGYLISQRLLPEVV